MIFSQHKIKINKHVNCFFVKKLIKIILHDIFEPILRLNTFKKYLSISLKLGVLVISTALVFSGSLKKSNNSKFNNGRNYTLSQDDSNIIDFYFLNNFFIEEEDVNENEFKKNHNHNYTLCFDSGNHLLSFINALLSSEQKHFTLYQSLLTKNILLLDCSLRI